MGMGRHKREKVVLLSQAKQATEVIFGIPYRVGAFPLRMESGFDSTIEFR